MLVRRAETLRAFRRDGAVKLAGVFAPQWIEMLRTGLSKNLEAPSRYAKKYTPSGKPGFFFGDYCNWRRIPEYESFLKESPAADIARALMESQTVVLFHEHVLVKEPNTEERTPWHHDQPYYIHDGAQTCSLWIPLDPIAKETCVEFVAGSHTWGQLYMPAKFTEHERYQRTDGLQPPPDIDAQRHNHTILKWDLEPGDAIAFHFLTLHGAPGNASPDTRRRAFAARYVGDDAVYCRRAGEVSPPFPDVALHPGDPLRGDDFPVVRA